MIDRIRDGRITAAPSAASRGAGWCDDQRIAQCTGPTGASLISSSTAAVIRFQIARQICYGRK